MPPRDRRRARSRSSARAVPILVGLALLAFFLIGGVAKIDSSSGPFTDAVNGSLAAQGSVIAQESDGSSASLRSVVAGLDASRVARPQLAVSLASLVSQTGSQLAALQAIPPPWPDRRAMAKLQTAFELRARAMRVFRSAIDALLQMAPLGGTSTTPDVTSSTAVGRPPIPITAAAASAELGTVGALLATSDSAYGSARHLLADLPRGFQLSRSRWVGDPSTWGAPSVTTFVDRLAASPLLALSRNLTLLTTRLDPGAVPSTTASGAATIPPTTRLTVAAVLGNGGNVAESSAHLSATLQPEGPGASVTARRAVSLAAGASVAVVFAPLRVRPGSSYTLTISLVPPEAQPSTSILAISTPLLVAPAAPPHHDHPGAHHDDHDLGRHHDLGTTTHHDPQGRLIRRHLRSPGARRWGRLDLRTCWP